METRPVWVEINLDHLAHNIKEVRRVTKSSAMITAVIKADGYGHGASEIAKTLLENGADRFAVATLSEGISLRCTVPDVPILVLGYTPNHLVKDLVKYNLIQTVYTLEQAQVFNDYAKSQNAVVSVHLKVDTGMGRLGFLPDKKGVASILTCYTFKHIDIEGVYTHFARADEADKTFTHEQAKIYLNVVNAIEQAGYKVPIKHVSNSAAIIDLPEYNFDMVRAGIMLYGLYPSKDVKKSNVTLREVMSLKARVSLVKTLPAKSGVSYGHMYKTDQVEVIGSLPLGYADGFTRMLSEKTDLLFKGKRLPLVGRICMDQCMFKAMDTPVKINDIVTLFGTDEDDFKSIDEIADAIGTINYEVVCMIDKRVPRHYYSNNMCIYKRDDILILSHASPLT